MIRWHGATDSSAIQVKRIVKVIVDYANLMKKIVIVKNAEKDWRMISMNNLYRVYIEKSCFENGNDSKITQVICKKINGVYQNVNTYEVYGSSVVKAVKLSNNYNNYFMKGVVIMGYLEQLKQLLTVTWDGYLISKSYRDELIRCGYAARCNGFNYITAEGIQVLINLGILKP